MQKYIAVIYRKHALNTNGRSKIKAVRPEDLESSLEKLGNLPYLEFEMKRAVKVDGVWYVEEEVTE